MVTRLLRVGLLLTSFVLLCVAILGVIFERCAPLKTETRAPLKTELSPPLKTEMSPLVTTDHENTGPKSGPERIAKLIEQMGSPDFTVREAATTALRESGFPAREALRTAAKSKNREVARRAIGLIDFIDVPFDELVALYREYGLPLPHPDAKLVRIDVGGSVDGKPSPAYLLGFLLRPGTKESAAVILVGTYEYRLRSQYYEYEIVEPTAELMKDVEPCAWSLRELDSNYNAGLATALQFRARGWNELAKALWDTSIKRDAGHSHGLFLHPANLPPRTAVGYLAWSCYCNQLAMPDTDRALIAMQIKKLFATEPCLNSGADPSRPILLDQDFEVVPRPTRKTEGNQAILESLEAALVPSTAKAGSLESLIDDLTEMCKARGPKDTRYARIAQLGFKAVPSLIEHLDDIRLTRSVHPGFMNSPPNFLRVQDVVSNLLQEIAGGEIGPIGLKRLQGWGIDKAEAQTWWEKACRTGEEVYCVEHVLPKDRQSDLWMLMLQIVAEKYPGHLPKLYRTLLDQASHLQSWPIAEAVSKSSLPEGQQHELFLYAATHWSLEHRRPGLTHLLKLDPEQAVKLLIETLESLPRTPSGPYSYSDEANFVRIVAKMDDPRAWKTLETVAKRSDVGLRMEFIQMTYTDERRNQRLAFLATFLDDSEVRDVNSNPKMFAGCAAFTFSRLAVRDLAAWEIAHVLGMPVQPDPSWKADDWAKLRATVKIAIRQ
jgi:hypothetical protein